MAHVVKYHPSISLLEQFTEGTLAPELSLIVAAHMDFCPHCQQICRDLENDMAIELAMSPAAEFVEQDFEAMLSSIIATSPIDKTEKPVQLFTENTLQLEQHQFKLPRSLRRLATKRKKWLHLGGIATAKLPSSEQNHLSLLYISTDTEVPLHTHKGLEITLVLAGEMVDEMGKYAAGDLIINTPDHTHTPRNISQEPCLCLSVLTAPLEFKQGLTRLLNPLQRFFY